MEQFPFFTPLASSLLAPLPFLFTYLESLLWRDAIPSALAPGCSQTDLPLPNPTPIQKTNPPKVYPNKLLQGAPTPADWAQAVEVLWAARGSRRAVGSASSLQELQPGY
jgi:hypothetical protein